MKRSDTERASVRTLTRGQTIDLMERRQEAVVLRYMRQIGKVDKRWAAAWMEKVDFRQMSKRQIVRVMATEQAVLEGELQRQVRWRSYGRV